MEFKKTSIEGIYIIYSPIFSDERGDFCKTFNDTIFNKNISPRDINVHFTEHYYSVNYENVIRGMHYQSKPCDLKKLVYVSLGSIKDVVLDIRKNSPTCGKHFETSLFPGKMLFMVEGIAHGFLSESGGPSIVNYACTSQYNEVHDRGILWNSFGCKWNSLPYGEPTISDRDKSFKPFERYGDYGF